MSKKILNVKVGADVEVFIKNVVRGEIISAEGLIGGSKDFPQPLDRKGCALQEDNVMAEFNVNPTNNPQDMYDDILYVLNNIVNRLPEGYDIAILPSAKLHESFLNTPQAMMIGCDPDFNAWKGEKIVNIPPDITKLEGLRTCGGHIHIGYDNPNPATSRALIKALDLFLTVPSIIKDTDTERRKVYGKAGAFRYKPYGVELRTLSNFWIKDLETVRFIFNGIANAVEFINSGSQFGVKMVLETVRVINEQDIEGAKAMIEKYNLLAPAKVEPFVAVVD